MDQIQLENESILLSVNTIQKLFSYKNGAEVVALYLFYHKQCKLQKTNRSFTVSKFAKKGLGWGDKKFKDAKKVLKDLGLIEDVCIKGEDGKVKARYIKLNYIKSQEQAILSSGAETHPVDSSTGGGQNTNALSSKTINALSSKTINALSSKTEILGQTQQKNINPGIIEKSGKITPPTCAAPPQEKEKWFNEFRDKYPNKKSKPKAKIIYMKIINKELHNKIMDGIEKYLKEIEITKKEKQYIKHPSTWLNNSSREDEYITKKESNVKNTFKGEYTGW